tara:strand:- start:38 stop:259 length:222 start_codon:yes stop_codon:yes gene_type:complete
VAELGVPGFRVALPAPVDLKVDKLNGGLIRLGACNIHFISNSNYQISKIIIMFLYNGMKYCIYSIDKFNISNY